MNFVILIFLALFFSGSESSRILFLYPTPGVSHLLPLHTLSVALAEKGHDITFVSTFPLGRKVKNYRDIVVPFNKADTEFLKEVAQDPTGKGITYIFPRLTSMIYRIGNDTLQNKDVRKLMAEESFDLVIVGYFLNEFMFGMADHFKCPSIIFSPIGSFTVINQALGNPLSVSGTPQIFVPVDKMDFFGRLKTFVAYIAELGVTQYFQYKSKQIYDFNFPSNRYRSYEESLNNISLALLNGHFSSGTALRPYLPNMIEVGGLQVKASPSPLPEDLKTFLDEAKDGAILFSMGSNAKSVYLPAETIKNLLKVFSQLKQRVVMKWESDTLEGKPANVFISKWLPQDDVLAHPNIKLFMSHCGLGGVVEAKHHGVPILGFPLFGDQETNAASVVKEGWGVKVEFGSMTENILKDAIAEVLGNPKYAKTVKAFSGLVRDRPMSARDTAVYWVEYVLRHRGAPHLHYPGADMNFLQYNSIDVVLLLFAGIFVIFKVLKCLVKKVCYGKSGKISERKQKKN